MDGQRFDTLTRMLAVGTNRHRALGVGGSGVVAGLLTLAGLGEVAADDTHCRSGRRAERMRSAYPDSLIP